MPKVGILVGSKSDLPVMENALKVLEQFGVEAELHISSAHRTPEETARLVDGAGEAGWEVIIAAAGYAAHLAGTVAARSVLPVIGVPLKGGFSDGLDSLLSTVQMPRGVPVACVAVGETGAHNAGVLAVQILALKHPELAKRLRDYKEELRRKVREADDELNNRGGKKK